MAYVMPYGHRTYHFFYTMLCSLFGQILTEFLTHVAGRTRCPHGPHAALRRHLPILVILLLNGHVTQINSWSYVALLLSILIWLLDKACSFLTLNSTSVHIAFPWVIIGSRSSPLPSQQSNSIHLSYKQTRN